MARNGNYNAPATSMAGCTIKDLADEIGLESGEFRQWLTFTNDNVTLHDGTQVHKDSVTADMILGANSFQIPNTMYMAWFGEMGTVGQGWMNWGANKSDLARLGFKVVAFNNDDYNKSDEIGAKRNFLDNITWLSNEKFLHGMYMMGHGSQWDIGSNGTKCYTSGPIWDVLYGNVDGVNDYRQPDYTWSIGGALNYHLGTIIIHACESNGSNAESLKSSNGFFVGQTGTYVPLLPERIARHWGYETEIKLGIQYILFGGKQRTKIMIGDVTTSE